MRERGRLLNRERERGVVREREKDEESMRIGKKGKVREKDVPKLYAYNECELSVLRRLLLFCARCC